MQVAADHERTAAALGERGRRRRFEIRAHGSNRELVRACSAGKLEQKFRVAVHADHGNVVRGDRERIAPAAAREIDNGATHGRLAQQIEMRDHVRRRAAHAELRAATARTTRAG